MIFVAANDIEGAVRNTCGFVRACVCALMFGFSFFTLNCIHGRKMVFTEERCLGLPEKYSRIVACFQQE